MSKFSAEDIKAYAAQLADKPDATTGDWYGFARTVMRFADENAHGSPVTLSASETLIGRRVRVQPYVTVPRTVSSNSPMRLPVTVPGVITDIYHENGSAEYAYVDIDADLLGFYPFSTTQQFIRVTRRATRGDLQVRGMPVLS